MSLQFLSVEAQPLRSGCPCCFEPCTLVLAGCDCGLYEWTHNHLDVVISVVLRLCSACSLGTLHSWHEKQLNDHHELQSPGCLQPCRNTAAVIETVR